jgi:hypothetical protein
VSSSSSVLLFFFFFLLLKVHHAMDLIHAAIVVRANIIGIESKSNKMGIEGDDGRLSHSLRSPSFFFY